jgi:hypothetical protein
MAYIAIHHIYLVWGGKVRQEEYRPFLFYRSEYIYNIPTEKGKKVSLLFNMTIVHARLIKGSLFNRKKWLELYSSTSEKLYVPITYATKIDPTNLPRLLELGYRKIYFKGEDIHG